MKLNLLIATGLLAVSSSSWGAVAYDQLISSPPGVIYGSGNGNGGWAVDIDNGVELALRTHKRYPTPANTFSQGTQVGVGIYEWADTTGYGPSGQNRSSWNYDFALNSGSNYTLAQLTFQLWIDSDPTAGHAWTMFDPTIIPDNAVQGGQYAQNSENARFAVVGVPGYDNTIAGSYDFSLRAFDKTTGTQVANTYMRVNVNGGTAQGAFNGNVPDTGATLGLLALSLGGLGALRRKLIA